MSDNVNAAPQPLDKWFLDLLACPACTQHWPVHLQEDNSALVCACGRYAYPVRDGLPIMILEEAELRNPDAHPEDVQARPAE